MPVVERAGRKGRGHWHCRRANASDGLPGLLSARPIRLEGARSYVGPDGWGRGDVLGRRADPAGVAAKCPSAAPRALRPCRAGEACGASCLALCGPSCRRSAPGDRRKARRRPRRWHDASGPSARCRLAAMEGGATCLGKDGPAALVWWRRSGTPAWRGRAEGP